MLRLSPCAVNKVTRDGGGISYMELLTQVHLHCQSRERERGRDIMEMHLGWFKLL